MSAIHLPAAHIAAVQLPSRCSGRTRRSPRLAARFDLSNAERILRVKNEYGGLTMVDTIPRMRDVVRAALSRVRASTNGCATFASWDDARRFEEAIHDHFPAGGYGTSTDIKATTGGFTVTWRVFSAD
jgi:hypothetical protein